MNEKKILLVEDDPAVREFIISGGEDDCLRKEIVFLVASTQEEAWKIFLENPDIWVIFMDGGVPGSIFNTGPLIEKIRKTFSGPIVAISLVYGSKMLQAGCDYDAGGKFWSSTRPILKEIFSL